MQKQLLFLFALFFTFAGASAQEVKRVISLTPSITTNIYSIGAQDLLTGCSNYCYEGVKDGKEIVGSAVDVNIEKIFSLKPDIVLTMTLTKPQDIASLKRLGIKVVVIQTPKTFEEICEQTLLIGELIGRKENAKQVVDKSIQKVELLKKSSLKLEGKPKIFFQIGANPIFTVLQNTFMDDYILLCNGVNIANGLKKGTMTRESILLKNPDVIIIATMGGFGNDELKVWNNYKGLNAVSNNKVFLIESDIACSPTPENFASALEQVYQFVKD